MEKSLTNGCLKLFLPIKMSANGHLIKFKQSINEKLVRRLRIDPNAYKRILAANIKNIL